MDWITRRTFCVSLAVSLLLNALGSGSIIIGGSQAFLSIVFFWYGISLKEKWFSLERN